MSQSTKRGGANPLPVVPPQWSQETLKSMNEQADSGYLWQSSIVEVVLKRTFEVISANETWRLHRDTTVKNVLDSVLDCALMLSMKPDTATTSSLRGDSWKLECAPCPCQQDDWSRLFVPTRAGTRLERLRSHVQKKQAVVENLTDGSAAEPVMGPDDANFDQVSVGTGTKRAPRKSLAVAGSPSPSSRRPSRQLGTPGSVTVKPFAVNGGGDNAESAEVEKLRARELKRMLKKDQTRQLQEQHELKQKEAIELRNKQRADLKGKELIVDTHGNMIVVNPLAPEHLPSIRYAVSRDSLSFCDVPYHTVIYPNLWFIALYSTAPVFKLPETAEVVMRNGLNSKQRSVQRKGDSNGGSATIGSNLQPSHDGRDIGALVSNCNHVPQTKRTAHKSTVMLMNQESQTNLRVQSEVAMVLHRNPVCKISLRYTDRCKDVSCRNVP